MSFTIEATDENGVLVPVQPLDLADHERVRLTVERVPVPGPAAVEAVRWWREHRIKADPQVAQEIAPSPEFLPEES
jgi:predicted DNA-binding antitoxin AbrB/MazE fold protein